MDICRKKQHPVTFQHWPTNSVRLFPKNSSNSFILATSPLPYYQCIAISSYSNTLSVLVGYHGSSVSSDHCFNPCLVHCPPLLSPSRYERRLPDTCKNISVINAWNRYEISIFSFATRIISGATRLHLSAVVAGTGAAGHGWGIYFDILRRA